jgi:hypothetical protein
VLLLSNGFMHVNRRALTDRSAVGAQTAAFDPVAAFIPQKVVAKNRLTRIAAMIGIIAAFSTMACLAIL